MYFPGEETSSDDQLEDEDSLSEEDSDEDNDIVTGGEVYSWGYNWFGQLGVNNNITNYLPKKIPNLTRIISISCGEAHSVAAGANGTVYSWGCNRYGQLGVGDIKDRYTPIVVEAMRNVKVVQVACGLQHTCLLARQGEVYTMGCGGHGRLGHGETKHQYTPRIVSSLRGKKIVQVGCGAWFTSCVSNAGALYTWGSNKFGQLGVGKNPSMQLHPRHVTGLYRKFVTKLACGKHHIVVFTAEGECYSWGGGMCGQLGHRSKQNQLFPKLIEDLVKKRVVDIECGYFHTIALTADGKLCIWGYISDDHLGLSEGEEYHSAPMLINISHVKDPIVRIFSGGWHASIVTNKGELFTWGFGYRGRLGIGPEETDVNNENPNHPLIPTLVETLKPQFVSLVSCGGSHTLAIGFDLEIRTPSSTSTDTTASAALSTMTSSFLEEKPPTPPPDNV